MRQILFLYTGNLDVSDKKRSSDGHWVSLKIGGNMKVSSFISLRKDVRFGRSHHSHT